MRSFLIVFAAGLAVLAVLAATNGSALVYTLGVQPQQPVATLNRGDVACQAPLVLPRDASFERVAVRAVGGERVEVEVFEDNRSVRRGAATPAAPPAAGMPPNPVRADMPELRPQGPLTVCVTSRGSEPTALWGTVDAASGDTVATLNDQPLGLDLSVDFEHAEEQSLLALAPEMAERASLFRARWLSPAAYAVLALLVLVAVPILLAGALRSAARP
jgi:hypothetical protein